MCERLLWRMPYSLNLIDAESADLFLAGSASTQATLEKEAAGLLRAQSPQAALGPGAVPLVLVVEGLHQHLERPRRLGVGDQLQQPIAMGVVASVFLDQFVDVVSCDQHQQMEPVFSELRILVVHEPQRARVVALRVPEQAIPLSFPVLHGPDAMGTPAATPPPFSPQWQGLHQRQPP
jgi:hypothetical protein